MCEHIDKFLRMPSYSDTFLRILDVDSGKPHIFKSGDEWDYVSTAPTGGFSLKLNYKADIFCQKLNNAAPKRGLKA